MKNFPAHVILLLTMNFGPKAGRYRSSCIVRTLLRRYRLGAAGVRTPFQTVHADVSHAALGPQADPPLNFLKARIVPQIVEMRPHFDHNQVGLAIVTRPV